MKTKLFAIAKEIVATTAINKKDEIIFFGPCLSKRKPSGICIIENPIK